MVLRKLNAVDLGWDLILRFRHENMPPEFYTDWVRCVPSCACVPCAPCVCRVCVVCVVWYPLTHSSKDRRVR
jgi:hypothetical protein